MTLSPKTTRTKSQIVTFVAIGVLIIGLIHFWQVVTISTRAPIASSYGVNPNPIIVRQLLAFVWASVWLWQAFQLYRHRQSEPKWLPLGGAIMVYTLFQSIQSFISPSLIDQQRWLLLVMVMASMTMITAGIVLQRRRTLAQN